MVCCKVCFKVDGKEKLLNLKLDGLQNHVGKQNSLVVHLGILMGEYCIKNDSQHQKDERILASWGPNSIMEMVVSGGKACIYIHIC
jgi:hypothetical protein